MTLTRLTKHPLLGLVPSLFLVFGCDETVDDGTDSPTGSTESQCDDEIDNDDDGNTDCDDSDCRSLDVCNPEPTVDDADVSGMPIPTIDDLLKPSGDPGNLVILDWAGFKSALSYTFDDNLPSQIEHYDELQAPGVRMTFFPVSDTVTHINTWSQAVSDGHEIGNHTVHHCSSDLGGCWGEPLESAEAEIETCSEYIIDNFGQEEVWTMASPYGVAGWAAPAEQFVFLNRSVDKGSIAPDDNSHPFNLPSWALAGGETADDINAEIDTVRDVGEWLILCFHFILPSSGDGWAPVDIESITGSIDHAKELEDVWMDSMVNVGAYWMGQKILLAVTPETDGENTVWTWTLPDHFPSGRYLRVTVDGGILSQNGEALAWSPHGYYEVALDEGKLTLSP